MIHSLNFKKIWYIISSSVLIFLTYLTFDYSGLIKKILNVAGLESQADPKLIDFFDLFIKVNIFIFLILIFIISHLLFFHFTKIYHMRLYHVDDIVNFIRKRKLDLEKVTIFGYSLSFLEPLRFYLDSVKHDNLIVNIICPSPSYIKSNVREDKPISYRSEQLKGRIVEWNNLRNANRIKELNIVHYDFVPVEYGVLINNDYLFVSYYSWEKQNESYKLKKRARSDRGMLLIKQRDTQIFNYVLTNLKVKGL